MKSGRIFWGTLFIIIGILGVLYNFFDIHLSWHMLWKFWPLLLVLLGISAFLKDSKSKWIIVAAIGLLAGVVIFSSIQKGCSSVDRIVTYHDDDDVAAVYEQVLTVDYDSSVSAAVFRFEGGAGRFEMNDTTASFARAEVESSITGYQLERDDDGFMPVISLRMEDASVSWEGKRMKNRVAIALNTEPVWNMDIDAGAAKIKFDLRPYIVRDLQLETGAASMEVRLGSRADTCHVSVETGVSSLKLYVPEDVGCSIHTETALSSRNLVGFERGESGAYRSPNYDDTAKRMFIDIESGLSSITIERYAGSAW